MAEAEPPDVHPARVVLATGGPDGHDDGAEATARALRDAGFEVIWAGLLETPAQVAEAVLQEDADAVGLSVRSGAPTTLLLAVVDALRTRGREDALVFARASLSAADAAPLHDAGVAHVVAPDTPLDELVAWLAEALAEAAATSG